MLGRRLIAPLPYHLNTIPASRPLSWQWGAIDVGFIVVMNAIKRAPLLRKIVVLYTAWEHHLLYNVRQATPHTPDNV